MRLSRLAVVVAAAALVASAAVAQVPTGVLTGTVTDGAAPLPGVTVSVTSPSLQGVRTAVSGVNGDYIIRMLPPGTYTVKLELAGFQVVEATVKISAAQTTALEAVMPLSKLAEEITVTGSIETISTSTQAATTFTEDFVEKLPRGRTIEAAVLLAPGVSDTGPGGGITISGSQSWENQWTINGVVVNENIRGQALPLYIEDAVQETTTQTANISAEYGRFAGGMINVLTKSGGNELHGSLRVNLTNDKWAAPTPLTVTRNDKINKTYEATLGGWFWRDRLWYFVAGRSAKTDTARQTLITKLPYTFSEDEKRYEGKLTLALTSDHRFVGSYIKRDRDQINNWFSNIMDLRSLYDRSMPEELLAVNYSGALSSNLFVEAQYSSRKFTFVGSGSQFTDPIYGTLLLDRSRSSYRFWSPTFCGVCEDEKRDNKDYLVKASYFLATEKLGSHDLVVGVDQYEDMRFANNHQSGSDSRIYLTSTIIKADGTIYPVFEPDTTYLMWNPIFMSSKTNNFKTKSIFVNDKWRLNKYLSFNVGLRYDKNDGRDGAGTLLVTGSHWSPRFAVSFDPKGDGDLMLSAGYADYVVATANGAADNGAGGNPATFNYNYKGPAINSGNPANPIPTEQALQMFWDWFNNVYGGFSNYSALRSTPSVPGLTPQTKKGLGSPYATETTFSVSKRLGTKGVARFDYITRDYKDLYISRTTLATGTVNNGLPAPYNANFDLSVVDNASSDELWRKYEAYQLQAQYRFTDRIQTGLNYTWSHAWGNTDNENTTSGPLVSGLGDYPEYTWPWAWYAPVGDLAIDQRHRARAWFVWDVIQGRHNRLSASVLQSYLSGTPYGAVGAVNPVPYVPNPGYLKPSTSRTYYYTARDAYRTDNITATDFSLNYSFVAKVFGADLELYVQPEVFNVFNEKGVTAVNTSVNDPTSSSNFKAFNPFNTTPKECPQGMSGADCKAGGYNWQKGSNFGKPTATTSYQTPRTFRVSFGVRF